jgi:hypothetical protein
MNDNDLIQAMAARKTGADVPPTQQAAQPPAQPAQEQQAPAPQVDAPTTQQEKVAEKASPTTEGDKANQEPVLYNIAFGEQERQLTDKQIKSTFDRYSSLNHKHQNMKPIIDFAEKLMNGAKQQGKEVTPEQFVQGLQRAFQKNAQFGKGTNTVKSQEGAVNKPTGNSDNKLDDAELARWEEENAVSLPPAYKESFNQLKTMQSDNQQLKELLKQLVAGQKGITQGAKQGLEAAAASKDHSQKQRMVNNLNQAQAALQLPDESDRDFFNFAYDRGYTIEDFIDPQLTLRVAQDFKNNLNSPEIDRLRSIAQRRQAFTGTIDSAPTAGGTSQAASPDQSFIDSVASIAKQKRNLT